MVCIVDAEVIVVQKKGIGVVLKNASSNQTILDRN